IRVRPRFELDRIVVAVPPERRHVPYSVAPNEPPVAPRGIRATECRLSQLIVRFSTSKSGGTPMHHSRFSSVIIDCRTSDLTSAAKFWSEAFGRPTVKANPANPTYVSLKMHADEVICQVQSVPHESRVHLDIETDDIDAEVARLVKLGAREV